MGPQLTGLPVWNTHARISKDVAQAHINDVVALTPPVTIASPLIRPAAAPDSSAKHPDLDSPDEIAARSLLLGILHRTAGEFQASRQFLEDALSRHKTVKISTWVGGLASFEMAVLDLKEAEAVSGTSPDGSTPPLGDAAKASWQRVLKAALERLEQAMSLAPQSVDLSSRLDTRVSILKDEIATKREMVESA